MFGLGSQKRIAELKAQVAAFTTERDALQQQVAALTAERDALQQQVAALTAERVALAAERDALFGERSVLAAEAERLRPYAGIADVDAAIRAHKANYVKQHNEAVAKFKAQLEAAKARINQEYAAAKQAKQTAETESAELIKKAKEEALREYEAAAAERETAKKQCNELVDKAKQEAADITAKAIELAGRENRLRDAVKAMKNAINGYDDSYLVASNTYLDYLADQYDHKNAGQDLKEARQHIKTMVKNKTAAKCEYVELERRNNVIRFILDAFNGKVDSILAKVKQENYGILKQQIIDAFNIVNSNGEVFRNAHITDEYLQARLKELELAVAVYTLMVQDREEQKRIKQQMREEERARREYEKAMKEAEKEERLLAEAMAKVQAQMQAATAEQRARYEEQLKDMEERLRAAEERNQRALSMAQQTKRGHVYVISNIGSFGEDVFKIGMTRRLEPLDRVRELGDASVPFPFDVHAMIYSEDAPALEHALHLRFTDNQLNRVNPRKEFFRVNLADVRQAVSEQGLEAHWTMRAEAAEYRESLAMLEQGRAARPPEEYDEDLEEEFELA